VTAPAVEAENLVQVYNIGRGLFRAPTRLQAVSGISFAIQPGRTLAVVGESGCGKSTLGRMVALIEPPAAGTLRLDGIDAVDPPPAERTRLRRTVQLVFQNPYGSLNPRKKIGAILEEPLAINTGLPRAERTARAREMMAKVGLRPEHYGRYPHMFSGGQRQRIAIARALVLNPKLLVADEPVSALDVSIQAQVVNLLLDLQERMGIAYLFISHDLRVVRQVSHDVAVMYLGRIVEQGEAESLFAKPTHPYTRALVSAIPVLGPRRERLLLQGDPPNPVDVPSGCAFHTRCPFAIAQCRAATPALRPLADGRQVACHRVDEPALQVAA
jgi:dipeptide transport system ATP-binding protein